MALVFTHNMDTGTAPADFEIKLSQQDDVQIQITERSIMAFIKLVTMQGEQVSSDVQFGKNDTAKLPLHIADVVTGQNLQRIALGGNFKLIIKNFAHRIVEIEEYTVDIKP